MQALERNVKLYPYFRMAADGYAWITVFFLYMSQTQTLAQVIQLSSIYYLSVFVLEVPSGYFSDRVGRRATLLLASAALIGSYICFIVGASFAWFAAGQFLLAAGISFQSGTDTAFHYDSLKALGRESEYAGREAHAEQWAMICLALATLAGGVLGLIDLRLAYGYSLLSAIVMTAIAWRFVEPRHADESEILPQSFVRVVAGCIARLRDPLLGWLFALAILLYALAHFAYELYQPYITLLELPLLDARDDAALVSGIVIAISMFGGALGARVSIAWQTHLGLLGLLAVATVIQIGIVAAMALVLSPIALALVFARNFPMALVHAPTRAAIAPRIGREQRATYLSLQGLSERFVFALLLLGLAAGLEPGAPIDAPTLQGILRAMLWIGCLTAVLLFGFARPIQRVIARDAAPERAG